MPTDLPQRRHAPAQRPKATRAGNLAFAIAVLVMLAISILLLWLHPVDAAVQAAGLVR